MYENVHFSLALALLFMHIEFECGKDLSIGIIARLRHFVPLSTLQHRYRLLIQPYLLHGITAWGRADKNSQKQNPTSSETWPSPHVIL